MDELAPPLFLLDGGDLEAFASLDELCRYVEPVDAATGGLVVFDSEGRRVKLRGEGVRVGRVFAGGGETKAEPSLSDPDPEALLVSLACFVRQVGPDRFGVSEAWVSSASLDALVAVVSRFLKR